MEEPGFSIGPGRQPRRLGCNRVDKPDEHLINQADHPSPSWLNHVVLTHDYPDWSIYINGQKKLAHWTEAAEMPGIAMPIRLGNNASYQSFDGGFYSIRISDSNLFSDAGETFEHTQARYSMIRPNARTLNPWLMGPEPEEVTFRKTAMAFAASLWTTPPAHDIRVQDGTWSEAALDSTSKTSVAKPVILSTTTATFSATHSNGVWMARIFSHIQ